MVRLPETGHERCEQTAKPSNSDLLDNARFFTRRSVSIAENREWSSADRAPASVVSGSRCAQSSGIKVACRVLAGTGVVRGRLLRCTDIPAVADKGLWGE